MTWLGWYFWAAGVICILLGWYGASLVCSAAGFVAFVVAFQGIRRSRA